MNDWATESLHQGQMRIEPEPPFEDARRAGARAGAGRGAPSTRSGRFARVLCARRATSGSVVRADCWDERAQALVDPAGKWYWESTRAARPRERPARSMPGLVAALEAEGVEVVYVEGDAPAHLSRPIYTRDPLLTVPGRRRHRPHGAGDAPRRGAARHAGRRPRSACRSCARSPARACVEGGSFAKLRPTVAAYGTSIRCNEEGARQLEEVLRWLGIELIVVPLRRLLDPPRRAPRHGRRRQGAGRSARACPDWFLERLDRARVSSCCPCPPGEEWAINSLALRPGRVLMCEGYPRTRELLERRGVEVVAIPYDEIQKGGGGVHCSTMELVRDPA